jgi:hypothetical protein
LVARARATLYCDLPLPALHPVEPHSAGSIMTTTNLITTPAVAVSALTAPTALAAAAQTAGPREAAMALLDPVRFRSANAVLPYACLPPSDFFVQFP